MTNGLSVFILSAGSELVSLSLAEYFIKNGNKVVIFSNQERSIFQHLNEISEYNYCPWTVEPENAIEALFSKAASYQRMPIVFPSEDSSLSFLIDHRETLDKILKYTFSSLLTSSGYDKSEFFEYFSRKSNDLIPETLIHNSKSELVSYLSEISGRVVLKPATKPASMDLSDLGAKAILITQDYPEKDLKSLIDRCWHISPCWITQEACLADTDTEYMWGGTRTNDGSIINFTAIEEQKMPLMGGTSIIVKSKDMPHINQLAAEILETIEFVGLCEISFRRNHEGKFKALELNPRPWLQINLAITAQPDLLIPFEDNDKNNIHSNPCQTDIVWLNPERLFLSILKSPARTFAALKRTLPSNSKILAPPYTLELKNVALVWVSHLARTVIGKIL